MRLSTIGRFCAAISLSAISCDIAIGTDDLAQLYVSAGDMEIALTK